MSDVTGGPAVEVHGLVKGFGSRPVLQGVDLEVAAGEFVAVVGRSGAGKSTLLHLLAGLDRPTEGEVRVAGVDLRQRHRLDRFRRQQVGIVFQLHNLVPRLTATQNVELALFGAVRSHTDRRARARELLGRVGLGHRLDSHPPELSGGERQRVAVARAVANRPAVLLADEPTGSLDDAATADVLDLFESMRADAGVTIVAASHDPRLVGAADRVVELEGGVVRSAGAAVPAGADQADELAEQLAETVRLANAHGLRAAAAAVTAWMDDQSTTQDTGSSGSGS